MDLLHLARRLTITGCVLATCLAPAFAQSTEPPRRQATPTLAVDEAFAKYIAPDALTRALASRDPSRLADVGLQLAEAERVLKRRQQGITAEQVLRQAEQRAIETGDKTTLDRLARAAADRNDKSAAARLSKAAAKVVQPASPGPKAKTKLNAASRDDDDVSTNTPPQTDSAPDPQAQADPTPQPDPTQQAGQTADSSAGSSPVGQLTQPDSQGDLSLAQAAPLVEAGRATTDELRSRATEGTGEIVGTAIGLSEKAATMVGKAAGTVVDAMGSISEIQEGAEGIERAQQPLDDSSMYNPVFRDKVRDNIQTSIDRVQERVDNSTDPSQMANDRALLANYKEELRRMGREEINPEFMYNQNMWMQRSIQSVGEGAKLSAGVRSLDPAGSTTNANRQASIPLPADPAFDSFASPDLLAGAIQRGDASLLTDAGLLLAEGERKLNPTRRGISASAVLALAEAKAKAANDQATLGRLARARGKTHSPAPTNPAPKAKTNIAAAPSAKPAAAQARLSASSRDLRSTASRSSTPAAAKAATSRVAARPALSQARPSVGQARPKVATRLGGSSRDLPVATATGGASAPSRDNLQGPKTLSPAQAISTLRDPAFDAYVDLRLLGLAWDKKDPSGLADAGLRLAEGEHVLRRSHRALHASDLLETAARAALARNDRDTIQRLASFAKETGNGGLGALVMSSSKLGAGSRDVSGGLGAAVSILLPLDRTAPQTFAAVQGVVEATRRASIAGDIAALDRVAASLTKLSGLSAGLRKSLGDRIAQARQAVNASKGGARPANGRPSQDALNRLGKASRDIFGDAADAISSAGDAVSSTVDQAAQDASNAAQQATQDASNVAQQAGQDASNAAQQLGQDAPAAAQQLGQDASTAGQQLGQDVKDAANSDAGKIAVGMVTNPEQTTEQIAVDAVIGAVVAGSDGNLGDALKGAETGAVQGGASGGDAAAQILDGNVQGAVKSLIASEAGNALTSAGLEDYAAAGQQIMQGNAKGAAEDLAVAAVGTAVEAYGGGDIGAGAAQGGLQAALDGGGLKGTLAGAAGGAVEGAGGGDTAASVVAAAVSGAYDGAAQGNMNAAASGAAQGATTAAINSIDVGNSQANAILQSEANALVQGNAGNQQYQAAMVQQAETAAFRQGERAALQQLGGSSRDLTTAPRTSAPGQAELADPAFDMFVDTNELISVWRRKDSRAMVDAALKLDEGERVLLRPRGGVTSAELFLLAAEVARASNDPVTLRRIARIGQERGDAALVARSSSAGKLGSSSRDIDQGSEIVVNIDEMSPAAFAAFRECVLVIKGAKVGADRAALDRLEAALPSMRNLDAKTRLRVRTLIGQAREQVESSPANSIPAAHSLNRLGWASRDLRVGGTGRANSTYSKPQPTRGPR